MRRRHFIAGIGVAATALPLALRAQKPAMPVIGFLTTGSFEQHREYVAAFHRGLASTGNVEGRNFTIEYRWTDGQTEPLAVMAAELVSRHVAIIATRFTPPALAAKAATQTIPIVFTLGADPVELGLIDSLAHPGHNATGIAALNNALTEKRLEFLHELLPAAKPIGFLFNPVSSFSKWEMTTAQGAARALGVELLPVAASSGGEFDRAFNSLTKTQGVLVSGDALFLRYEPEIFAWANRTAMPAVYTYPASAVAGGLMSYGTNPLDNALWMGEYAGRILNGERPADMPVRQNTLFYLVINLKTAKTMGLTIPPTLLARAHQVIE